MKISIERKYLYIMLGGLISVYSLLFVLLNKYYNLTLAHFVAVCKITFANFISSKTHLIGLLMILLIILACSTLLLKMIFSYFKTTRKISKLLKLKKLEKYHFLEKIMDKLGLDTERVIIVNTKKHLAFSFGLINPKIIISTGLLFDLSRKELEAVIIHESYHLQNSHVFFFMFIESFKSLLFFIPVVETFTNKIKLELEHRADQNAVSFQGTDRYLRLALANTISQPSHYNLVPNFSTSLIEHRVNKLLKQGKEMDFNRRELFISFFILFGLITMFLAPTTSHAKSDFVDLGSAKSCDNTQRNMSTLPLNATLKP